MHYAWQRVELEPLLEEAHQQLLRLLARSGRRNIVLAHYQEYCHLLQTELAVTPSATTVALVDAIRAGATAEANSDTHYLAPPLPYLTLSQPTAPAAIFVAAKWN
ncbi:MAG TPA: bacterial transcriptional activator domain-containing protein [Caldilineaceae bacterium]|nr:bacterial transcriptional activator domain-containing protein [Caldilineaceae bacterium]